MNTLLHCPPVFSLASHLLKCRSLNSQTAILKTAFITLKLVFNLERPPLPFIFRDVNTHHCRHKSQRNTVFSIVLLDVSRQTSFLSVKSKSDAAMELRCYVCPEKTCPDSCQKRDKKRNTFFSFCSNEHITWGFYSTFAVTDIDQDSICMKTHRHNHPRKKERAGAEIVTTTRSMKKMVGGGCHKSSAGHRTLILYN